MTRNARAAIFVFSSIAVTSSAWADGDNVAIGSDLFASRCAACHGLNPTRKPGPPLAGVYGRRAGSVPTYHYSAALKGASVIWNQTTLDRWLRSPPAFIPGVNMQAQVDGKQDRRNLIAYLKSLGIAATVQHSASSDR